MGDKHPDTLGSMNNLAALLDDMGKRDEVEPLNRECLAAKKETLGDKHPSTLASMKNLASLLKGMGKRDEDEPMYRSCLATRKEMLATSTRTRLIR